MYCIFIQFQINLNIFYSWPNIAALCVVISMTLLKVTLTAVSYRVLHLSRFRITGHARYAGWLRPISCLLTNFSGYVIHQYYFLEHKIMHSFPAIFFLLSGQRAVATNRSCCIPFIPMELPGCAFCRFMLYNNSRAVSCRLNCLIFKE